MKQILAFALACLFLAACVNSENQEKKPEKTPPATGAENPDTGKAAGYDADSILGRNGTYCYITKAYTAGDTNFIEADYIQFLTGEAANKAARRRGDAEMTVDEKGDTSYSVPDGYYILNENPRIRRLPLAKNARLFLVNFDKGNPKEIEVPFKTLTTHLKDNVFVLTIHDGIVMKVTVQYLP